MLGVPSANPPKAFERRTLEYAEVAVDCADANVALVGAAVADKATLEGLVAALAAAGGTFVNGSATGGAGFAAGGAGAFKGCGIAPMPRATLAREGPEDTREPDGGDDGICSGNAIIRKPNL